MIRLLATPPAGVAPGIGLTWILSPSPGLLTLVAILSAHLALACLALVPIAALWPSRRADRLTVATWNLEFGAVGVQTTIDRLTTLDADIAALGARLFRGQLLNPADSRVCRSARCGST